MPDSSGLRNLDSSELSRLALLARISSMINSASRFEEVLERIMESVLEVIRAERAFVLLREESPGDGLYKASGVGDASYSSRIVASVHESGKALVSLDALTDDCLSDSKSIQMLGTRSVMCVPMRTGSKILGLIYLDSRIQTEVFTESDRDLLQIIADMSAVALERARLFSAMLQNAKMATLGTAIGGIAHELNSPLTSLMWLVERFKEELPDSAGIVPEFERELKRCRNLSRNLLRIVRKEQTPVERVYLSEALENSLKLVRTDYVRDEIKLRISCQNDMAPVLACPEHLEQVAVILLNNARQALAGQHPPAEVLAEVFQQGSNLVIRISDNGPGIPEEHLERIFDPFFTTKPVGEGTGLGLSLCQRLVKEHGGER